MAAGQTLGGIRGNGGFNQAQALTPKAGILPRLQVLREQLSKLAAILEHTRGVHGCLNPTEPCKGDTGCQAPPDTIDLVLANVEHFTAEATEHALAVQNFLGS